jgi:5-methylcytosine-specific restriction endonuclease McrA
MRSSTRSRSTRCPSQRRAAVMSQQRYGSAVVVEVLVHGRVEGDVPVPRRCSQGGRILSWGFRPLLPSSVRLCNDCGQSYDPHDGAYRRKGKCQPCTREYERAKRNRQRRARSTSAYQQAREVALRAAGYRCTRCGSAEQVETHHAVIRPGERGDNSPSNLVVLCQRCHVAQHSRPIEQPRPRFSRRKLTT